MAVTKEIVLEVGLKDSTGQGAESAKKRLREMQRALVDLAVAGKESTEEFRKLEAEAGELSDTIGDVSQRVKNMGSDTKNIEAFTQAVQGVAAGFQIAQGAAALFGEENEDIQKAMLQVNATMAIANGIMQVSTLLQKESAISMTANRIATALYDKTLKGSVVSLGLFRTALISTGIGAAIVAVGLLVENWDKLTAAVRRFLNLPDPAIAAKAREDAALREEAALSNYRDAYERHTDAQIKKEEERDRKQKEATLKRLERLKSENDAIIKFVADLNLELYGMELDRQAEQEDLQIKGMREEAARRVRQAKVTNDIAKKRADNEKQIQEEVIKSNVDISRAGFQSLGELATAFAGQSEASQKKAFQVNKAAGIAQAIIDTYAAAQGAFKSQLSVPDVTAPIRAKIAAGIAIAAGLARVAAISKTQFRSTSSSVPSSASTGGGGGGGEAAPASIFANPQTTMLGTDGAAMGQGQGSSPMRAYVVERDITQSTRRVRRLEEFATLGA
jgi:hypothetical protein